MTATCRRRLVSRSERMSKMSSESDLSRGWPAMHMDPQLEERRTVLTDAASMIRLLGRVKLAQMLDDTDHAIAPLDGILPASCDGLAGRLELEAARLRPELRLQPSASVNELGHTPPLELAPAGDMLSDLGVA